MAQPTAPPESPADSSRIASRCSFTITLVFEKMTFPSEFESKSAEIEKAVTNAIPNCRASLVGAIIHCAAPAKPSEAGLTAVREAINAELKTLDLSALKPLVVEDDVTDLDLADLEAVLELRAEVAQNSAIEDTEDFKRRKSEAERKIATLERKLRGLTGQEMQESFFDVIRMRPPPPVPDEWPLAKSIAELNLNTGDVLLFAGTHLTVRASPPSASSMCVRAQKA